MNVGVGVWGLWMAPATAAGLDAIEARLAEVAPLRALRLPDHVPTLPPDTYERVVRGDLVTGVSQVPGESANIAYGVGLFDVPIEALWATINDETRVVDPRLAHLELTRGPPCEEHRRVMAVAELPLLFRDRFWVNRHAFNHPLSSRSDGTLRELAWWSVPNPEDEPMTEAGRSRADRALPVTRNEGAWLLIAIDEGHTLAEHHTWVDLGGHIPPSLVAPIAHRGMRKTFALMDQYASAGDLPCLHGLEGS